MAMNEEERASVEAENDQIRMHGKTCSKIIRGLKHGNKELAKVIDSEREYNTETIRHLEAENARLEEMSVDLRDMSAAKDARIAELKSENAQLNGQQSAVRDMAASEVDDLKEEIAARDARIIELERENSKLRRVLGPFSRAVISEDRDFCKVIIHKSDILEARALLPEAGEKGAPEEEYTEPGHGFGDAICESCGREIPHDYDDEGSCICSECAVEEDEHGRE
jgi:DNA repair exonuclease SbcCD ATPase subunit